MNTMKTPTIKEGNAEKKEALYEKYQLKSKEVEILHSKELYEIVKLIHH